MDGIESSGCPSNIKERVKDFIPKDVIDKIATEKDVETIDQLKEFLKSKEHPIVEDGKLRKNAAEAASERGLMKSPLKQCTGSDHTCKWYFRSWRWLQNYS